MTLLAIIVSVIIGLLTVIYAYYKYKYRYWDKYQVKHTNPSFPFGDLSGIRRPGGSISEILNRIYKKFPNDPFVGLWFLAQPVLLVKDPEIIKIILVKDFAHFQDRGIEINERDDPLAGHLFSLSGTRWRNLRVKLTPTFTSGKMKMMFPIFEECAKQLTSVLDTCADKGQVIDMKEYTSRFTIDLISLTAFGLNVDCMHNPDNDFRFYGRKSFEASIRQFINTFALAFIPRIAKFFGATQTPPDVTNFFVKSFRDVIEYRKNNNIRRKDFLDLLIQLMEEGVIKDVDNHEQPIKLEVKFSFEEALAQAFVFYLAGFETSSSALQFALYELALNVDIQQIARDEIRMISEKYDDKLTYESINEMSYLGRVVDETLRKHPPATTIQRKCTKEYKLPNSELTLNTSNGILIDVLGLHNDSKYYPNPERFDPNRFTEIEKANRPSYTYLPFGDGPRNCIGMRFALMEVKVGLATILKTYEVSIDKESPVPLIFDHKSFLRTPINGMKLKISKYTK